jgi:hypothetical protein
MAESVAQFVLSDEVRALVGVEGPETTHEVTSTGCRLFARAVGHTDVIFYDRDHARSRGYRDIVAPPGFLGAQCYQPGSAESHETGMKLPLPYKRVLNGGTAYEYLDDVCAGDVLTARSKTVDIRERTGSIGPMLIVYRETTYRRPDGEVVAKMYGNTIHY